MKNKKNGGQSLFEVVLSIAVITLITVGIIIMATNSIRNSSYSKNKTLASRLGQEAIEWVRKQRDLDISDFVNTRVPGVYCFDTLSWTNTGSCNTDEFVSGTNLLRQVTLTNENLGPAQDVTLVEVVVSWTDSQGYHEIQSSTNLNDARQL